MRELRQSRLGLEQSGVILHKAMELTYMGDSGLVKWHCPPPVCTPESCDWGTCLARLGYSTHLLALGQEIFHIWLSYSTLQNAREPDLGLDSVGNMRAHLCGTTPPGSLGTVMGQARLDHTTHLKGDYLTLVGVGTGRCYHVLSCST